MVTSNLLAPPRMLGCKITSNIVVIVIACHFKVSSFQQEIQTFLAENFRYEFRHDTDEIYRCGTSTKTLIISCPHFQAICRMSTRGPITHANCSGKCHEKF